MTSEGISFLVVAFVGFLFFGYLVLFVTRSPKIVKSCLILYNKCQAHFGQGMRALAGLCLS